MSIFNSLFKSEASTSSQVKHLFVTGGVISGLGKGLTASSIGLILKSAGYKITMQKFDPYLNPDPGTMSPYEHGEVFVTDDGGETDLDLGNYERFIDVNLPKLASATTGQVYQSVLNKERKGEYLGKTIQVIPHIVDEIKMRMRAQEVQNPDIIITEIGGTVGDIESQPFLEAARQMRHELGSENVFFVHCSLIPFIKASGEMKTKPTQHSVMALRQVGISPNALILRSELEISESVRSKIGLMCDVNDKAIVNCVDVPSIYDVPAMIKNSNLIEYIIQKLQLTKRSEIGIWKDWDVLTDKIHNPVGEVEIALVGKYVSLHDSYLSVSEALKAAGFFERRNVKIRWVDADSCVTQDAAATALSGVDGVLIPGGFGDRGVEGKIGALKYARVNKIPLLGICLGLQTMCIEYARNVVGLENATSTEFDKESENPVIATMAEQVEILGKGEMGGTMRLGSYDAKLVSGSLAAKLYGTTDVKERHRHRYEVNEKYRSALENAGLRISGVSAGKTKLYGSVSDFSDQNAIGLVEFVELDTSTHPFYISTQAHPEFKSRPTKPHPLFLGLIKAAVKQKDATN